MFHPRTFDQEAQFREIERETNEYLGFPLTESLQNSQIPVNTENKPLSTQQAE